MDLKCVFYDFEMFFNDLSSSLISFVRSRDPAREKTTKIGAAAKGPPICRFLFWWSSLRQGLLNEQN